MYDRASDFSVWWQALESNETSSGARNVEAFGTTDLAPSVRLAGFGVGTDAFLIGTTGSDALDGTADADLISGENRADSISGLGGDDILYGDNATPDSSSSDTIDGGAGRDAIYGSLGGDVLRGGTENDTLRGSSGNDALDGGDGADVLTGGADSDALTGGLGADTFTVGTGTDGADTVLDFSVAQGDKLDFTALGISDVATINALLAPSAGNWTINYSQFGVNSSLTLAGLGAGDLSAASWTLATAAVNDLFIGGDPNFDDRVFGGFGEDLLSGGDGADWLFGEQGNDVLYATGADDIFDTGWTDTLDGGAGNDELIGAGNADVLLGGVGNDRIRGEGGNDAAIGGDGADNLFGGSGNDNLGGDGGAGTLSGGDGFDVMTGGAGADRFIVGTGFDDVDTVTDFNAGEDKLDFTQLGISDAATVFALLGDNTNWSISYGRAGETATTSLTGVSATDLNASDWILSTANTNDFISGSDISNSFDVLFGGLGNDVIYGLTDDDLIFGESGNDILYSGSPTGGVESNDSDTLDGGSGNDQLIGGIAVDRLLGGSGNDLLDAGGADDNLDGGDGNDTLNGGSGTDLVNGGAGNDTASYAGSTAALTVDLAIAAAQNVSTAIGFETYQSIENLTGGSAADNLKGDANANRLDGGLGIDTLTGRAGNDIYGVDDAGDVIVEAALEGTDRVESSVTWSLGDNLENLTLLGTTAINGTGNGGNNNLVGNTNNNILTGNGGADTLTGGGGTDTLRGGDGNDTYFVDSSSDVVTESNAATTQVDTVNSTVAWTLGANLEKLTLSGSSGISGTGNALANTLLGNTANNVLDGKVGADTLTGGGGADIFAFTSAAATSDLITDFLSGTDDLRIGQSALRIGDGDTAVEGAVSIAGPGGFAASAEFVVVTSNIAGSITGSSAAAAIGSANGAYTDGATRLFAVDNGSNTALYLFTSAGADAQVSAAELQLITTLQGTASIALGDVIFGP